MDRYVRAALWVVAAVQSVMALGFVFQVAAVTGLWPFPGATPLTNIFIGSIFAAAAASTAWCLAMRSDRGPAEIALDYLAILVPFSVFSFAHAAGGAEGASAHVAVFAVTCVAGALVGLMLLRWSLGHPWRDPRPTPRLVRGSFAFFVVALVVVASLLIARVPDILPWPITPELSTLIGIMFLGAAAYFAYGVVAPRWENAGGQMAGFLAYDVVLIIPFLVRLPTIDERLRINLIVYTAVVAFSGLLAIWYLALDPRTRGRAPAMDAGGSEAPAAAPAGPPAAAPPAR
jgi:hypothetical protein